MSGRRRVAVYDLYWSTFGGGEQVAGTIAQALSSEHDVTLLGPEPIDTERTAERLGVDLTNCGYRKVADDYDAAEASAEFDVFVNGTYQSRVVNRSPVGWYYVHFPQVPPTPRDRWRHRFGVAGVKALSIPPRLPARFDRVRAGFDRRVVRTDHLGTYERFLANSRFTAGWVERLWGVSAEVLYPPVRPEVGPGEKQPLILNVGRFFDPRYGHSKKQLELIEAFNRSGIADWRFALAGGCDSLNRDYALAARRAAIGHPVDVHVNAKGDLVHRLLAEASIYWHGGGFGEDPRRHPHRFEHFGITVVEAMAAGAVPVVFAGGGPAEIVEDGVNGYHWHDVDELLGVTRRLMDDEGLRHSLSVAAQHRATDFSAARFSASLTALLA
jgi:glycosyltransferase involved in cell wall biosynthesis